MNLKLLFYLQMSIAIILFVRFVVYNKESSIKCIGKVSNLKIKGEEISFCDYNVDQRSVTSTHPIQLYKSVNGKKINK